MIFPLLPSIISINIVFFFLFLFSKSIWQVQSKSEKKLLWTIKVIKKKFVWFASLNSKYFIYTHIHRLKKRYQFASVVCKNYWPIHSSFYHSSISLPIHTILFTVLSPQPPQPSPSSFINILSTTINRQQIPHISSVLMYRCWKQEKHRKKIIIDKYMQLWKITLMKNRKDGKKEGKHEQIVVSV